VGVSWNDAKEFCKWLTKRERSAGDLPEDREYRLPKDEEWSAAVGLKNEAGSTPEGKNGRTGLYPWGIQWTPPNGAGNYSGEESKVWTIDFIKGYKDDCVYTSPVGSFAANLYGLYDMEGNVWQWCEDWYDAQAQYRVLRGESWVNFDRGSLLASFRLYHGPDNRYDNMGFHCVIAVAADAQPAPR
jgi:formylglycine-generating enzyme required for sulfatase activity